MSDCLVGEEKRLFLNLGVDVIWDSWSDQLACCLVHGERGLTNRRGRGEEEEERERPAPPTAPKLTCLLLDSDLQRDNDLQFPVYY